ncbi:MFS transporter [Anaerocolumna sp. AGMB13020]|uniref:MFS transporter n=1 Tax=Anaerocolumna sp. AGMB13020 TaxID=3081750 RepID=UPI0029532600|nr:MFS transporter [Anaerocolumna sp. AGMB13020]WOO36474.1 MFS transporter [Anaerocolumna sp. AGMB13020]
MKKISKYQEIIFLAMVSLFWFAQYVYMPYQTMYLTAYGVTSSFVGVVIGAYGISQLLLRFPIGLMADSAGRHKLFIVTGALAAGMASLIRIFWPGGAGFLAANLLSGLASSMWISFMVFYTNCYVDNQQQTATSRIILFNNLGILLGFVTSALLYDWLGMQTICILSFAAGALAFCLGLLIKEPKENHETIAVRKLIKICLNKRIWMFAFIALIQQGIQLSTTMSFTSQILRDLGATGAKVGLASIVYMISAVGFSGFASSRFCVKRGPKFWIPLVLVFIALYCILVPSVNSVPVIFLLQILPGMSTGILFSFATSEAMKEVPKEKKSTAMGFFQAFYAIGMTLFPVLTGDIASRFNIRTAYFVLAGIAVMGCFFVLYFYISKDKLKKVVRH